MFSSVNRMMGLVKTNIVLLVWLMLCEMIGSAKRKPGWVKMKIDILLWWMLYEKLTDRYRNDEIQSFWVN